MASAGGGAAARVEAIWIAEGAGAPMRSLWSPIRRSGDGLTLIEGEVVDELIARYGVGPGDTRRNVVTRGADLPHLVGREIRVGSVRGRVVRLCEPCAYLDGLLGTSLLADLVHRGGVRVEILDGGRIAVGDSVAAL